MANIPKKPDFAFIPSSSKESKAYSILPTNGDGDFTFYRNSTTTRVNKDGQLESWPKNLYPNSEIFGGYSWTRHNSTVTVNTTVAPNETLTASTLTDNSTNGRHIVYYQDNPITTPNTVSIYAKANTAQWLVIDIYNTQDRFTYFDLVNGVIGNIGTGITALMTYVGNGWYRCSCSTASSTNGWIHFGIAQSNGVESYIGVGNSIFIWGFQRELSAVPTPYMPTTTRLNLPTIDYTDGGPALLLNPERTNLQAASQVFTSSPWTTRYQALVSNSILAPDGTLTATKVTQHSGTQIPVTFNDISLSDTTYSSSLYVKGGTARYILFKFSSSSVYWSACVFDTYLGVFTKTENSTITGVFSVDTLSNGWYRLKLTVSTTISSSGSPIAFSVSNSANPTLGSYGDLTAYAGDGTSYIYIWGAQTEVGANASSYIPTIGSTVTRVLEGGTTNFIPKSNRVTVYAEFKLNSSTTDYWVLGFRPAGVGSHSSPLIYDLYYWGSDSKKFGFNTWNGDSYGITNSTVGNGKYHKVVAVFDYTNFANNELYIDGVKQTISQERATTAQVTTKNNFALLSGYGTTSIPEQPNASYREIYIWDTELTDAECIDLTSQQTSVKNIVNEYKQFVQGSGGVLETENNFAGIIQSLK